LSALTPAPLPRKLEFWVLVAPKPVWYPKKLL
jgi:hypothetical protein